MEKDTCKGFCPLSAFLITFRFVCLFGVYDSPLLQHHQTSGFPHVQREDTMRKPRINPTEHARPYTSLCTSPKSFIHFKHHFSFLPVCGRPPAPCRAPQVNGRGRSRPAAERDRGQIRTTLPASAELTQLQEPGLGCSLTI